MEKICRKWRKYTDDDDEESHHHSDHQQKSRTEMNADSAAKSETRVSKCTPQQEDDDTSSDDTVGDILMHDAGAQSHGSKSLLENEDVAQHIATLAFLRTPSDEEINMINRRGDHEAGVVVRAYVNFPRVCRAWRIVGHRIASEWISSQAGHAEGWNDLREDELARLGPEPRNDWRTLSIARHLQALGFNARRMRHLRALGYNTTRILTLARNQKTDTSEDYYMTRRAPGDSATDTSDTISDISTHDSDEATQMKVARGVAMAQLITRGSTWTSTRRCIVIWKMNQGETRLQKAKAGLKVSTNMSRVEHTIRTVHTPALPLTTDEAGDSRRLKVTQMPLLGAFAIVAVHLLEIIDTTKGTDIPRAITMSESDFTLSIRGDAKMQEEITTRLLVSMLMQGERQATETQERRDEACQHFAKRAIATGEEQEEDTAQLEARGGAAAKEDTPPATQFKDEILGTPLRLGTTVAGQMHEDPSALARILGRAHALGGHHVYITDMTIQHGEACILKDQRQLWEALRKRVESRQGHTREGRTIIFAHTGDDKFIAVSPENLSDVVTKLGNSTLNTHWIDMFRDIENHTCAHLTHMYNHMRSEYESAAHDTRGSATNVMSRKEATEAFRRLLQAPRERARYYQKTRELDECLGTHKQDVDQAHEHIAQAQRWEEANIARGALWTCENVLEMEDAQALVRQALSMTATYADVGTLCQVNNLQLMTQTARVRREALDIEVMLEEGQPEQPEFIAKLRDSLQSLEAGTSELRQLTQQQQEDEPQGMDGCEHEEKSPAVTDDTSRCNLNAQEGMIQDIINIDVSGGDTASPKQGYPQFKQNPPWEVNHITQAQRREEANIARGALWTCENVLEMEDAQALVRQALSMTATYADVGTLCQVNNLQLMTQTARVRREALDIEVMLEEGQPEQPEFIAKLRDSLQSLEAGTSELRQLTQQQQEDEPQGMDGCEHEEKSPAVTDDTSRCNLNAQEGMIQDIINIDVSGGDTASPKQGYPQFKQNPPWEVNLDTALAAIEGIADAATHSVEITPRIHNVLQETIIGTQAYEEGIMANQMHIREVLGATVAMQAREDTGSMKGDTLQQLAKHRENLVDKIADISASIRDREDLRNDIRTQITTNTLQLTWQMYAVMTHGGHREIERRVELEIQRIILRDIVHLTTVEWERERWEPICIPKDNLTNVLVQVGISDVQAEAVNEWIDEAKLTTTIFDETGDETGEAWPQVIDSRTLFASITQDGIPQFVREAIRHVCELVVESDRGKALWAHGLIDTGAAGRQSRLMDTDTAKNSISEVNGDTVGEAWEATQMLFIKVTASKAINDLNRQTAEAGAKKEVESYKTATAKLNKTVLEKMKVLLHESLESQGTYDTAEIRAQLDTVQSRAAMKTLLSIDTGPSISPQEWRKMIDDALSTAQWENTEVYESAEAQKYRRLLKNIIIQHTEFVRLTGEESQRSGDDEEEASQSEDDGMAASSQRPKATKRAPAKQDKSSQETKKQLKKRYEARERTRQDEYEAAMLQNRKEVLRAEEEALQAKIRAATAELDAKNQEVRMQHERLTQSKEDRGTKRDSRTEDTKWALASPPESRGRRRPAPSHHTTERERRVDWKKRWSTTMVPVRMMREIVRKYFDHIQQAPRHIPTEVLDTVTITTRNDKKGDISAVQAMMLGIETQVRYTPVTSEEIDMETVRDYWRQLQLYCREPHREMWQEYICGNEASATIVKLLTLLSGEGETSSQQRTQMRGGLRDYLLSEEPQTLGQSGVTWISISAQLKTGTGKHPAWETYGGQIRSMKIPREVRNKLQEVMPSARIGNDTPWPGVWTAILGAPMVEARAAAYTMYAMASELQFPKAVTKKYKEEAQKHMLAMVQEMADFVIQQIREQLETLCSKFSLKLADTKRLINGTGYVADTMEAAVNMLLSMDQTSLTDIMRSCTNENRVSHEMLETISQRWNQRRQRRNTSNSRSNSTCRRV